jgi:glycine/D-amino acid oxidase-like deaminating enzyme
MSETDAHRRVAVIGSGSSGAMAALTLLERDIPVTFPQGIFKTWIDGGSIRSEATSFVNWK